MEKGKTRNKRDADQPSGQNNEEWKILRGRTDADQDEGEEDDDFCPGIQMVDGALQSAVMVQEFMPHQDSSTLVMLQ
jgi:hypothetical protein